MSARGDEGKMKMANNYVMTFPCDEDLQKRVDTFVERLATAPEARFLGVNRSNVMRQLVERGLRMAEGELNEVILAAE